MKAHVDLELQRYHPEIARVQNSRDANVLRKLIGDLENIETRAMKFGVHGPILVLKKRLTDIMQTWETREFV